MLISFQGRLKSLQEEKLFVMQFEMSIFETTGFLGVALYLGSYAALQLQLLDSKGIIYPFLNFLAASCVLISLSESFNMSSAIIQISWITISSYGIIRLLIVRMRKQKLNQTGHASA